jgi:hypothetical protein
MKGKTSGFLLLLVTLTAPGLLVAQVPRQLGAVRGGAGGTFILALPTGELASEIDAGPGIAFNGHYGLVRSGALRLRVDLGFVQYGNEEREVCFSATVGCRIVLDLHTENNIAFGGIGPELALTSGPLRPYVNAGVGFSYFETASRLDGADDSESFARTRHISDTGLAFTGGGGFYVPLRLGRTPIALDLGARYHRNGTISYLREGDIHDNPDGTISFTPTRTAANLVTVQLGVSVGLRAGRPGRG